MSPKRDKTGTRPGGNPTGAAGFALAQRPRHLARRWSMNITRNRDQELLTENPAKILISGRNRLIING